MPCMTTQVPFTGGSGRILDRAFELAGVAKAEVFLTNVVHCHPPANRASRPYEIENCASFLEQELGLVAPLLIIGFGRDAAAWLRKRLTAEWDLFERLDQFSPSPSRRAILLARHPAYILRRASAERATFAADLAAAVRWSFSVRRSGGTPPSLKGLDE